MLAIIGIPAFLMELQIGQYSALGPVTLYSHLSPVFKGLGFANFISQCFVGLYYNMIIAWTIYYLFASFTSDLPWQYCDNEYNDQYCFSFSGFKECDDYRQDINDTSVIYMDRTCMNQTKQLNTVLGNLTKYYGSTKKKIWENGMEVEKEKGVPCFYTNLTLCNENVTASEINWGVKDLFDIPVGLRQSAAGQYLRKSVLEESDTIDPSDFGTPSWSLTLCLLAAWIVIFLCLIKGIKSSGKVVYFTATFPYLVLVILLIRAVLLEGAGLGISFYLTPKWERLSDIKVWEAAAVQIFFSLSVAGGGLITLSSYNKFNNNILRDTAIVCIGNCMTSFVAGFAIFSVLGYMASELGVNVEDVATGGTGLAFEAYPDLVTRLPAAPLWAILFFLMLFTLGLDSQFAIVETILTGIMDFMPTLRPKKTMIVGAVCLTGFILGLPLCCPGGSLLLDLLDYYAASWPYLFIGLMEFIIIAYVYGYSNFVDDLFEMTRAKWLYKMKKPAAFFYCFLSPLTIFIIFIFSWYNYEPLKKGDYEYPGWANGIGWIIAMTAILSVPLMAVVTLVKAYMANPGPDSVDKLVGVLEETSQHTVGWRQNAVRNNRQDGEKSEFEYRQQGDKMVRHRRVPGITKSNGFDNIALNTNE
jgi:solute carrier family 6 amino acid transporter-like protein 5/7/9/14